MLFKTARQKAPDIATLAGLTPGRKVGPCPLHGDDSPSFSIYDKGNGQRWKCHAGCGGGDALDLIARLEGRDAREIARELAGGAVIAHSRLTRREPEPEPAPAIDPEKRREVMALWIKARARIEDRDSQAARYLESRIGTKAARIAIERQLAGDTDGLAWQGRKIGFPYSLAVPLLAIPAPGEEQDERPVDLVRRRLVPSSEGRAKILSLEGAAPGLAKSFGSVPHSIQGERVIVVEGAVNWVSWSSRGELAIGLHGATTARKVAERLRAWLDWQRERGWSVPSSMAIDTDDDEPGTKAARVFAKVGAEFGMVVARTVKR